MSTVLDRLMRQSHGSGQLMHLNSSDFGFEVMVMRYSWRETDETGSQKWHIVLNLSSTSSESTGLK